MFACKLSEDVIFNLFRFKVKICHFSKRSFNNLTVIEFLCRSVVLLVVRRWFYSGVWRPLVIRTAAPVCCHLQRLDGAEERQKSSTSTWTAQTLWGSKKKKINKNCAFTCLRKSRWSSLRPGLSGEWHLSRSGERHPSALKMFSSSKHPVSIIWSRGDERVQVHFRRQRWKSVEVPRFARWWGRCLCWIWRGNLCPSGPEWLPSAWKTHRCPARRCSTRAWASQVKNLSEAWS